MFWLHQVSLPQKGASPRGVQLVPNPPWLLVPVCSEMLPIAATLLITCLPGVTLEPVVNIEFIVDFIAAHPIDYVTVFTDLNSGIQILSKIHNTFRLAY